MYDCTPKWKLNLHGKWFLLSVQVHLVVSPHKRASTTTTSGKSSLFRMAFQFLRSVVPTLKFR